MNGKNAGIAVAAIAVIAIVIVVGLQSRPDTVAVASPSPTLSRAPSAAVTGTAAPTASPAASASPAATASGSIYDDAFGFLVAVGDTPRAVIRTESSDARLGTVGAQVFAVSPDGTQVAYWTLFTSEPELHVRTVAGGAEQSLVTLGAGQRAGGVAWSSDGLGLLYSTEAGSGGVGGDGRNSATLNLYELAATGRHGTTIDTQTNTGWLYRPIAWDRSAGLAAAGLTGEGGQIAFYVTVRLNADSSFDVQRADTRHLQDLNGMGMNTIRASSDAKLVLGVEGGSGNIKWWPLADIGATKSQSGAGKRGALWRPGSHEIGFLSAEQLWLGDVDKAGSQGLCCTAFSGAPATSTLRTFRADGSAVVLGVAASAPLGQASYTLVRLGSDPKATSGDRVNFTDLDGLSGSVRIR